MSWSNLQMPERIELEESTYTDNFGRFVVQPLEKGYGVTVGNMLRRVLLSSLHGAAITSIKVNDIQHEFTQIDGVYEDITEIILNLKQVRIKLINKRPEKINLSLSGAMDFKAGLIQEQTTDFEVLNPDLHIATLNENANVDLELRIGKGRGYVTADENKETDQPIGVIAIDSIFTPVINVKYYIENTRVGQKTDFEKLILEIETDGSVTPDDALTYAGKILKDHIQLFINFDIDTEDDEVAEVDEETLRIKKLLKMNVDELELSVRSHNCLKASNIKTIGDLVRREEGEMLKFKNFGRKSLMELGKILEERGLQFGMNIESYVKSEDKI
ncbi:MAG: DNA-directed RNA polymerase subunit alpha [Calditrichaeota bacterium]|nr:MAG: DNA-directed RNA polymerase subunit alpha [Calditrichota bacterium]MBL1204998.1 DNA-directed RNA polymerase subunit alpha [Calditrichota bacterium]NOG44828.1 DNA-directed RNA polymerase subunit alpha [Calditrichota bacterium]